MSHMEYSVNPCEMNYFWLIGIKCGLQIWPFTVIPEISDDIRRRDDSVPCTGWGKTSITYESLYHRPGLWCRRNDTAEDLRGVWRGGGCIPGPKRCDRSIAWFRIHRDVGRGRCPVGSGLPKRAHHSWSHRALDRGAPSYDSQIVSRGDPVESSQSYSFDWAIVISRTFLDVSGRFNGLSHRLLLA
jgi:hypothetical protein